MYTYSQTVEAGPEQYGYQYKRRNIRDTEDSSIPDVSIENLVEEVMREELTSLRSADDDSPDSESSSDKDSLTDSLDHRNDDRFSTSALNMSRAVLVRMPIHVGGDIQVVIDHSSDAVQVAGQKHQKSVSCPRDPLCQVCGGKAGRHSYYGGKVCPSCRAFFRRSVQMGFSENLRCKRGRGICEVTLVTRKNCQCCRYKRCIAAGMRPSWILSNAERERRFHGQDKGKGHKSEKHGSSPMDISYQPSCSMPMVPNHHQSLTAEDLLQIRKYGEVMKSCCTGRHDDLDPHTVTELVQIALDGSSLSQKTAAQLHTVVENRTSQCFYLLQEFQSLPPPDQDQIIQNNLQMIHRFRQALWWGQIKYQARDLVELLMGLDKCTDLHNIPQNLSLKIYSTQPFEYNSLFTSPWHPYSEEHEVLHKSLMKDISDNVDGDDEIEIILIVLIIAFSPDFLDLTERGRVEKIQLKFVLFLQSHYRDICPEREVAAKVTKALMIPSVTRQILQVTRSRLSL